MGGLDGGCMYFLCCREEGWDGEGSSWLEAGRSSYVFDPLERAGRVVRIYHHGRFVRASLRSVIL